MATNPTNGHHDSCPCEECDAQRYSAAGLAERYPSTPRRITREQFDELLECLPPQKWIRRNRMESFQMMEYAYGNVTQITAWDYANEEGWTFHGPDSLTHEQIVAKIQGARAA